jgi:hypothetical protein
MDENSVFDVVMEVVKTYKPFDKQGELKLGKDGELPEYYDGYNRLVRDYKDILVHSDRGDFPEDLFREKSPNMSQQEQDYLEANYKNITLPVFEDFVNSIARAFSDGNWSLEYNEDKATYKEATFKEYINDNLSLTQYIKEILLPQKLKDANGAIAVLPKKFDTKEIEEDGEIVLVLNDQVLFEPIPKYYTVEQVVHITEELIVCESNERSLVDFGNNKEKQAIGKIYDCFTATNYYRIEQVGKYVDWEFETVINWEHDLGYLPAFRLKGKPILINGAEHYQSPFLVAVDSLDLALINENNKQTSLQQTMYPQRVTIGNACDFKNDDGYTCFNGKIKYNNDDGVEYTSDCPSCGGTGLEARPSRMGTVLVNPDSASLGQDTVKPSEAIHFAQPATEPLVFTGKDVASKIQNARNVLKLNSAEVYKGRDVTAEEKRQDLDATYAFIKPNSDQTFELFNDILYTVGKMRYGNDFNEYKLTKAINFDIRSKEDYTNEIKLAQEVGDPILIAKAMRDYLSYIFHTDENQRRLLDAIELADRLFGSTPDNIKSGLANGSIEVWEKILHESITYFVKVAKAEDEKFLEKDPKEQSEKLIELAKSKANQMAASKQNEDANLVKLLTGTDAA